MHIPYIKLVTPTYKILAQGTEPMQLSAEQTANFYRALTTLSQGPWHGVMDFVQESWPIAGWTFNIIEEGGTPELSVDFGTFVQE